MNPDLIKRRILKLLADKGSSVTVDVIARELVFKKPQKKRIQKWLSEMVNEGELFQDARGAFSLGRDEDLLSGIIEIIRSGDAFLSTADCEGKVRIDQSDLLTAMHGDTVLVRFKADSASRSDRLRYGKVIRIIERASHDIVGTYRVNGNMQYVTPIDRKYQKDFFVTEPSSAQEGDRVVVRFIAWDDPRLIPQGEIVDVIGPMEDASLDTLAVIKQLKIRDEFPESVLSEAENAAGAMSLTEGRTDLRRQMVVTIDPARARDFDDALSYEPLQNGGCRIGVHIADVSHFVREGGHLDTEAKLRGNSVYFPDKVVPMLPEQLSNGICSLRPGQDRFTFSAFLDFDSEGIVRKRSFCRGIINSRRRLTYEEALSLLKTDPNAVSGNDRDVCSLLQNLSAVAQKLRRRRFSSGALELDVPEAEFRIGANGMIEDVISVTTDESHQLVEEFMIAANEAVAIRLSEAGVPCVYRIHEAPFEEKTEALEAELTSLGLRPGNLKSQKALATFLKRVADTPLAHYARTAVLKSMNRAIYSTDSKIGHYGLAKRFYLHFTSPIRRYPDLLVHRQLAGLLSGKSGVMRRPGLDGAAKNCTVTERLADEAERNVIEIKKYRFLERELAQNKTVPRDSVIVGVVRFGFFVELLDLQVQGLVHVSTLSKGMARYSGKDGSIRAGDRLYKVGDRLTVAVSRVDFDERKIDFVPVLTKTSGRNRSRQQSVPHKRRRRR